MLRRKTFHVRTMGLIAFLALAQFGTAQDSREFTPNHRTHTYTLASLEGNYAITGVYGPHAAGFVGVTDITRSGDVKNSSGTLVDLGMPGPTELSPITGSSTVNPNGTGVFTLDATFVGGPAHVPFHLTYVITEARWDGQKLIATRIFALQQEPSNLPGAEFATLTLTRRPD